MVLTPELDLAVAVEESAAAVAVDDSSETPEAVVVVASQSLAAPAGCWRLATVQEEQAPDSEGDSEYHLAQGAASQLGAVV